MFEKDLFECKLNVLKKPFLRWTGGKNWLVKEISLLASKISYNEYHEPFIGGGSVFFSLNNKNKSYLSDYNADLINTYNQVKENPEKIIEHLKQFPQNKKFYYFLRDSEFISNEKRAAKFIYLNKTSFNGIYRVNIKGKYNVPFGKKTFDINLLVDIIHSCSKQLQNAEIKKGGFQNSILNVKKNDLIYLDPPYTISHNNNGFIKYNEKLFSIQDQLELSELIGHIKDIGAFYVLSNAYHPEVKKIYDKYDDKVLILNRKSSIAANNKSRINYKEYLFTNIN